MDSLQPEILGPPGGRSADLLKLNPQFDAARTDLARSLAGLIRTHADDKLLASAGTALGEICHG